MSVEKDLDGVLQQYAADTGVRSSQKVEQDFTEVAQHLPAEEVTLGLTEALRSEQTPSFEEMVVQSFEQSDAQRRAEMLKQLIEAAGPAAALPLVQSGLLPENQQGEASVTPELAQHLQSDVVQSMAQQAQQENPEVIERMSHFFAEDPFLAATLGGGTLSIVLSKLAEKR